jgi:acetyl-CoA acyltransferase
MKRAVIVDSVRTGMTKAFRGSLNNTRPDDQLAFVIRSLVERTGLPPDQVEDVSVGCAFPEGPQGSNIARVSALLAGLPVTTTGVTINRFCSSGSQAIAVAASEIAEGAVDVVIGAGVETITMIRDGNYNKRKLKNPVANEQFPGLYLSMGITAENVAVRYDVSREAQDRYAALSQQRTAEAQKQGLFDDEIVPYPVVRAIVPKAEGEEVRYEEHTITRDEANRPGTTYEDIAHLPPAFIEGGTVTAGNSSQLTDGASATLLMEEGYAERNGFRPLGAYVGSAFTGCEPDEMGIGPVTAVPKLLKRYGLTVGDIDLFELNEAFASQVVACQRALDIPAEKLNVNGGAIAIGHPFGMTGSRCTGHLLRELHRRNGRYGVVTMCTGGGMGFASLFERV